jgi:hypothetical protein
MGFRILILIQNNFSIMKKINMITLGILVAVITSVFMNSCATTGQMVSEKQGVQLWGENCQRCHNAPSPTTFNDEQWDVISTHMEIRANLTSEETKKIVEFLKSAN